MIDAHVYRIWSNQNCAYAGVRTSSLKQTLLDKGYGGKKSRKDLTEAAAVPPRNMISLERPMESPTKRFLEYLADTEPYLTLNHLKNALQRINRMDIVGIIDDYFVASKLGNYSGLCKVIVRIRKTVLEFVNLPFNNHGVFFLRTVFFYFRLVPDRENLFELQQMIWDTNVMDAKIDSSNMERIAVERGFKVSDNPGSGDCMFYALSEQLQRVRRIRIPHDELRKNLVQFLKNNPNKVSYSIAPFIYKLFNLLKYGLEP